MRKPRPIPLVAALLALVGLIGSMIVVAQRIVKYNEDQGRIVYMHEEVLAREFTYAGRPVSITDIPPDPAHEHGRIALTYGEESLTLTVAIPPVDYADAFPGLERLSDWMRLVRFAPLSGRTVDQLQEAIDAGEEADRLVMVTKSVRPGANPETWGKVWRKDWTFDFYEFLPEGGLRHERFAYPTVRSAREQQANRDEIASGDAGGLPELDTRSWQFQMAHLLMPEGSSPRIIAGDSPLVAVGAAFPAAIVSVLGLTTGLILAFAPARREPSEVA